MGSRTSKRHLAVSSPRTDPLSGWFASDTVLPPAPTTPIRRDRKFLLLPLLVFVAAILPFFPALFHGFTNWDDADYITKCTYIKYITPENIWFFLTQPYFSNYHPVTSFSYMAEYRLWRLEPMGYHAVNLALHGANAVLLYVLALRLTRKPWWALAAALLFAVHPLRVEVAVWLAARKDLLCTLFFLPALIFWTGYARTARRRDYWLSLLFFFLSILSKPMSITLPAVILLLDYLVGRRLGWHLLREKIPFILISILSAVLTFYAQSRGGSIRTDISFAWGIKAQTVSYGFTFYLGKFLWPVNLSPLYAYGSSVEKVLPPLAKIAPFVVLVLGAVSVWAFRRSRWWTFGILMYLVMLLPVIQIVPIGQAYAADRYTYLPMMGLVLALTVTVGTFLQTAAPLIRRAVIFGFPALLLVWSALTWSYTRYWENGVTLWEYTTRTRPDMGTAYNNLGAEYMQRGRMEEAYAALNRALEIYPTYALAFNNRGNYFTARGELEKALSDYESCIRISPASAAAYNNVGTVLGMLNREKEAVDYYSQAIKLNPFYSEAYINRANAWKVLKQPDRAIADFLTAVEVNPNLPVAYQELAKMLHSMGRREESMVMFELALRYAPDDPDILASRGTAYKSENRFTEALADFEKAFASGYKTDEVINNFGASLAELGQHERAISIYTVGLQNDSEMPALLANRAASFLRLGKLEEARKDLDKCIKVYPDMAMAWKTRGILNSTEQKIEEAIRDFDRALAIDESFIDARTNRAANNMILKRYDRTWEDVRILRKKGVKLAPAFIKQLQDASGVKE